VCLAFQLSDEAKKEGIEFIRLFAEHRLILSLFLLSSLRRFPFFVQRTSCRRDRWRALRRRSTAKSEPPIRIFHCVSLYYFCNNHRTDCLLVSVSFCVVSHCAASRRYYRLSHRRRQVSRSKYVDASQVVFTHIICICRRNYGCSFRCLRRSNFGCRRQDHTGMPSFGHFRFCSCPACVQQQTLTRCQFGDLFVSAFDCWAPIFRATMHRRRTYNAFV
jgi:hypothetical protein